MPKKSKALKNKMHMKSTVQGVPRNMKVAGRFESSLNLNLLVTFNGQPTFTCLVLVTITTKFSQSRCFQNVVCLSCCKILLKILRISTSFRFYEIKPNLNEILPISGNFKSTKNGRPHFGNAKTKGILLLLTLEFHFQIQVYDSS